MASLIGWTFILIGLAIRYFISRTKFNRRNSFGKEVFQSYEMLWVISIANGIGKIGSTVLIIIGIAVMIYN